jgi:hypothetical protein
LRLRLRWGLVRGGLAPGATWRGFIGHGPRRWGPQWFVVTGSR